MTEINTFLEDEDAQVRFGEKLGHCLQPGDVIFLEGSLGAGKTTLCRGILLAFGHLGAVKSPTYTLVEPYEFSNFRVYHFDLYRLFDPEELEYIGGREYFGDQAISLIEWPDRGQGHLPSPDLKVILAVKAPGRQVCVRAGSERGQQRLASLQQALA